MQKGCTDLASHKIEEINLWDDSEGSDEKEQHEKFARTHEHTTYLCDNHFKQIMLRDENVNMPDNRFEGRDLS
jgi:hypothetical protein